MMEELKAQESEVLDILEAMLDVCDLDNPGPMFAGQHVRGGICKIMDDDAAKLRQYIAARRAAPENKPLTMEGLKRMNHQPIWAVGKRSLGTEVNGWMLVDAKASRPAALDFTGACNFDSYSKTWLAYAHKPEGSAP